HGQAASARHQLGEVERETVGVVKLESEVTGNLGSAPAPGAVSRALAGNLVRRRLSRWRWSPQPLIILRQRNNSVVPRIATNVMKLLLQVRIAAHQTVKRFVFPNVSAGHFQSFVDAMRGGRLDAVQNFAEGEKHRLAIRV